MNIHEQTQSELARQDRLSEQMHRCTYSGELYHRSEMVFDMLGNLVYIRCIDDYAESQQLTQGEVEFMYNQITK